MILIFTSVLAFCFYMSMRNNFVLYTRNKMLDLIFAIEDYEHYLSMYDKVSYDEMLLHFWIWPIYKMWPDELQNLIRDNR